MTSLNTAQNNFTGGELSPKVYGRFDLAAYFNGLRRMENFIAQTQGGAIFRGGMHYVAQTKDNNKPFLHNFRLSNTANYVLEFTDSNIRFYRDKAVLKDGGVEVDVATPYLEDELIELKFAQTARDLYIVHPNHTPRKLTRVSDTVWTLTEHKPFGLRPSFTAQRIVDVTQANPAVVSYVNNTISGITKAFPAVVTYVGDDNYTDGDVVAIYDVVGMVEVNTRSFLIANVDTGANTFELVDEDSSEYLAYTSGGKASIDADYYDGDEVEINNVVGMTELNGNTYTVANVDATLGTFELLGIDSTAYTAYTSDGTITLTDNNPSAVGIYEQRLIYGGSFDNPETLWFSQSADFDNFTLGSEATDGLKYTVAVGESSNKIEWIKGTEDFLAIGGVGDLLKATGGQGEEAIAPDQISIKPTNTFGVADIMPIGKRQSIFYMQSNKRTLLSFEQNELGTYEPNDNNIASDHITSSGVNQIVYMEGRPDILWGVRNDGVLLGMTTDKKQKVSGWHKHTTQGKVISITTTPRVNDYDSLWVATEREVNGSTVYYIEYLNDNPEFPRREDFVTGEDTKESDKTTYLNALYEAQKTYIHVDSALTFNGTTRAIDAGASLTIGAVAGTGITFIASASVFTSDDVGNEIWIKSVDGTRFGRATIESYTSGTEVTCDIYYDFDSTDVYAAGLWYISADTITGLDHLEGEEVKVVVDGAIHPDRTVVSGSITLDTEATVVHVGLGFIGKLETMDLEGGGTNGTTQTKKKAIHKVGVRLLDALGLKMGTTYYDFKVRLNRDAAHLMDNPPPLFTGDETITFEDGGDDENAGWSLEKRVIIEQDLAVPAVVQLITPYYSVTNA